MKEYHNLSSFDEGPDILGELDDLFEDLPIDDPSPEQIFQIYGHFLDDIVKHPIIIKGITLSYNQEKSKHPICRGKMKAFEHIITRENKYNGLRFFDRERANKVHWIRPIIEYVNDSRILYFERTNGKGFNQQYYWYEEKGFIVIIREIDPNLMLITSFSVDTSEKMKFKRWYNEYRGKISA